MKNLLRVLLLFTVAAFVIGCKLNAITTIKPDGSGEWRTEAGFTAEERKNLESQSNAPATQDFCNSRTTLQGVTVTQEMRGDETWCISSQPFRSLDDLRGVLEQKHGLTINQLEIKGDRFVYDIDIDTVSKDSDYSSLTGLNWTLVLPGDPISHNADSADGRTLTWSPEPRSGIVHIHAESAVDKPSVNLPSLLIGAGLSLAGVLIIALGALGLARWMRRRSAAGSSSDPTTKRIKIRKAR